MLKSTASKALPPNPSGAALTERERRGNQEHAKSTHLNDSTHSVLRYWFCGDGTEFSFACEAIGMTRSGFNSIHGHRGIPVANHDAQHGQGSNASTSVRESSQPAPHLPAAPKFPTTRAAADRIRGACLVESKVLPGAVFKASHPDHGDLTITRKAKSGDQKELDFDLELTGKDGAVVNDAHSMFVSKSARGYQQSAVGYNYIDLDSLAGKGVGYVYHAMAAASAKALGVSLFVVDDVVEEAMHSLCRGAGMRPSDQNSDDRNSYSLAPSAMERACRAKAESKGWTFLE